MWYQNHHQKLKNKKREREKNKKNEIQETFIIPYVNHARIWNILTLRTYKLKTYDQSLPPISWTNISTFSFFG